jgi:pimeloyl-ACP methyl ester carboxylesterase
MEPPPSPSRWSLLRETRTALEPVRLAAATPRLARRRAATRRTVIALPGLGAGDLSTAALRSFLSQIGHRALPWELGRHGPDVRSTVAEFVPRVAARRDEHGEGIALVGWSLGGVVARETARLLNRSRPGSVPVVVTYGTPVAGPRATLVARRYSDDELARIDREISLRWGEPIGCPVVAIHNRNDGVVDWRGCIDPSPDVDNVEVRSSHFGMGFDPDIWTAVADALDRPHDR